MKRCAKPITPPYSFQRHITRAPYTRPSNSLCELECLTQSSSPARYAKHTTRPRIPRISSSVTRALTHACELDCLKQSSS